MKISILDCTLRDGGYVNNFHFGSNHIQTIKDKLCSFNLEIIECGFLQSGKSDPKYSLYGGIEQIFLPREHGNQMFVAMIAFGEMDAREIVPRRPGYIDGIRLTFHNEEWSETKKFAANLIDKGYKVFIQPVGTVSYPDENLLTLIKEVNELNPFAFYLVDTLGSMYKNDLMRQFFLVEHNLAPGICLGFHSHNNLQLSFANTMALLELHTERHIIIDSSVFGMGRGAGNLNTELITHYINQNIENRYDLIPLLELIDDIILPIYKHTPWGFSGSYYLSAIMGVHPNYATFLMDKQSVGMTKISEILNKLPESERHLYSKHEIETLYHDEMSHNVEDHAAIEELSAKVDGRDVLVIAPGGSIKTHRQLIKEYIGNTNPFVVSLNVATEDFLPDLIFVSNRKRFEQLSENAVPVAVTSNISTNGANGVYVIDYDSVLDDPSDPSGIIVLRFLIRLGIKNVALAGYDGFTGGHNHFAENLDRYLTAETVADLNESMGNKLVEIGELMSVVFITPSIYGA